VGYGGETRLEMASQDRHNTGNWTVVEASRLFDRRKKLEKGLWKNHLVQHSSLLVISCSLCSYMDLEAHQHPWLCCCIEIKLEKILYYTV
jgi:hypothetical protein